MRQGVLNLGTSLAPPGSCIVDLGCSIGDGLAPFVEALGTRNRYFGVDASEPMVEAACARFSAEIESGLVQISRFDLRDGFPAIECGPVLCVLSLQSTPIEHRQRLLSEAYARLAPGGAMLLVEKVLGASADLNGRMVDIYHELKKSPGYSTAEVERAETVPGRSAGACYREME